MQQKSTEQRRHVHRWRLLHRIPEQEERWHPYGGHTPYRAARLIRRCDECRLTQAAPEPAQDAPERFKDPHTQCIADLPWGELTREDKAAIWGKP